MSPQAWAGPERGRAPGIYVHVPFCTRVCPYCDFAVQTGGNEPRRRYVDALLREIEWWGEGGGVTSSPRASATTAYLGGGTPSSLSPRQLEEILDGLRRPLPIADDAELTLEVNPEDVTDEALAAWHELGFTRLSLGVQSFDDIALALLGRAHRADCAVRAVEDCLTADFATISVDLIFAVPGQSAASWEATLQQTVALRPQHISCYELTIHPGTRFFRSRERGRLVEIADRRKADLFFTTHLRLAEAGYPAYEASNFSRDDACRSRHNTKYWSHGPYLGVGPSSHSFDGVARRWWNVRDLAGWIDAVGRDSPVAGDEVLSGCELALEALALGLRTTDGVDLGSIEERHGVVLRRNNEALIERFVADGLLRPLDDARLPDNARLRPTLEGLALADTLAIAFDVAEGPATSAAKSRRGAR